MDQQTYLGLVRRTLAENGFEISSDTVGQLNVIVAKKKQFKFSWFATQLSMHVYIAGVENVTAELATEYSRQSIEHAIKNHVGLPRAMQSAIVAFAVLVTQHADDAAKQLVQNCPNKHIAAFEMPVIVDIANSKIYSYKKTPIWGAVYFKTFRALI